MSGITVDQMCALPQNVVDEFIALERERNTWKGNYQTLLDDAIQARYRIETLESALRHLRNEVHGSLYLQPTAMRLLIGNTNFTCIEARLYEADALLGITVK